MQVGGGAADSPGAAAGAEAPRPSRYESQKRRDWHTFGQYLRNHRPPLELARCSGAHVLEFLRYLDQFGKTKVHAPGCPFFGHPSPPAPCPCPLRQAWGSLDALVGRLRAAFEEHGGRPEANPFGARHRLREEAPEAAVRFVVPVVAAGRDDPAAAGSSRLLAGPVGRGGREGRRAGARAGRRAPAAPSPAPAPAPASLLHATPAVPARVQPAAGQPRSGGCQWQRRQQHAAGCMLPLSVFN